MNHLAFLEVNIPTGNQTNGPSLKPPPGLKTPPAPPPILLLPSQCCSCFTTHSKPAKGSQSNLSTLPVNELISSRHDCTLGQQQEHRSLWPKPPEKPPWAETTAKLLNLGSGFTITSHFPCVPEFGTKRQLNASLWACWKTKATTSVSSHRGAASFGANSEGVLSDKGHLEDVILR